MSTPRNNLTLWHCLVGVLILFYSYDAEAKVYIDIDSPSFQQYALAVPDFAVPGGTIGQPENTGAWFAGALAEYLKMTGFFNVIDKRAYLENPDRSGAKEEVRFADWLAIGAEYLVKGVVRHDGNEIIMECSLWDTVKGALITERQYRGKEEEKKLLVRRFAGEVLLALTGERDVFGTRIAFVQKKDKVSEIYSIAFDGSQLTKESLSPGIFMAPRWSSDGRYLSFTSFMAGNPDFYVKDRSSGLVKKIVSYRGINLSGGWSADGHKVLITLSKDGNEEIYLLDYTNMLLQRLTNNFSIDVSPAWSPDGGSIVFVSDRAGSPQIYVMGADGSNVRRLTFEGNYNTSPSWSPRGDKIAFESLTGGRFQIFVIGADGTGLKQLTFDEAGGESPVWSPEGRYLAFVNKINGRRRIYVMNANGSNLRRLYEGAGDSLYPAWSRFLRDD